MRLILSKFAALVLAAPAVPASAQAAPAVGMQIVDTVGAAVGTVTAIKGDNLQVKTDKHDALLPKSSFTEHNGKLLFGMTQAQLDAQIESSVASAQAAVAAGATVNGAAGTALGKIEAVENGQVTISLTSGKRIQVPSSALRGNPDGTVAIGYTAEQLEALVNGSAAATTSGGK
jgi:hypothetical protein